VRVVDARDCGIGRRKTANGFRSPFQKESATLLTSQSGPLAARAVDRQRS
jgi:hypothetical protein